jgi:hypothetical protein
MAKTLTSYEQETIINFNKAEDIAHIFTYEKTWQKHLEGRLGLKPVMDNGFGGKEYRIDKKRIPIPRVPRKLSAEAKAQRVKQLADARQKRILSVKTLTAINKSADKTSGKGESTSQAKIVAKTM